VLGKRALYLCHGCRKQTSYKAGTLFARTLPPLTTWFQGMYLLTSAKKSISTLEMARQLGVRPDTEPDAPQAHERDGGTRSADQTRRPR
jgi:hypothetical protein